MTYARVATKPDARILLGREETLHFMVVTSIESETEEEVLDGVRKAVDVKEG